MLNLKKTAVAVLAFGSSAVFAGTMGPVCTAGNVTVPCERSAWDFGVQALYLKPSYSGASYLGSTTVNGVETFHRANYNWGWGFKLEGSYHYGTGNDVNLNWYHLNKSNSQTIPATFTNPAGHVIDANVSATVKPRWDAVNLEFGQHVDFSPMSKIRFHGGAQYAYLQTKNTIKGTGTHYLSFSNNLRYSGFGPRAGADMAYDWGNGFGVYANTAAAVLVGTKKFTDTLSHSVLGVTSVNGSTTAIVPELEAKLGATYTYAMAQGDLSIDAGWMWINYFDPLQNGIAFGETSETNVGYQGPFVGLKWVGNVA